MKLIVGLGNPGVQYELTRHNVGFLTVDQVAEEFNVQVNKLKAKALTGDFRYKGEKIILAKPQTFMNNSGESVRELVDYYGVDMADLIVIYDDIDIPFGTIRIKAKGSAGSHNGMKSIVKYLKDENFPRIRISIGKKPDFMSLADYVLSRFSNDDFPVVEREILAAAKASLLIADQGVEEAMNEYNGLDFNE